MLQIGSVYRTSPTKLPYMMSLPKSVTVGGHGIAEVDYQFDCNLFEAIFFLDV